MQIGIAFAFAIATRAREVEHESGGELMESADKNQGISNRMPADDEAAERNNLPPLNTGSPEPEDASGRKGDEPISDTDGLQTSHKAGSRSVAQKESESRYSDR